jgi:uncharacterized membrane protein YfcA
MDWHFLIPEGLSLSTTLLLIISAGFTSFVSAAMGIGGGLLLLIIMANIMPLAALIPVHGLVQLGSNANRMAMTRHHIQWSIAGYFFVGAILAALVASFVLVQLPLAVIQIAIGVFVLALTWGFKPKKRDLPKWARTIAGFVTTFLTMFIGATGPLVAALIHAQRADRHQVVATFSSCMTIQHGLKIVVFGLLGFAFLPWLPLIIAMIISGAIGTWLGLQLLNRYSAKTFDWIFKGIITLLALRTLYEGVILAYSHYMM